MWKILVAEDDIAHSTFIVQSLKGIAECTMACQGEQALAFYKHALKKKKPFDLILLDVHMPKMDGFQVLKAIREHEELSQGKVKEAKVMMLTAYKDSLMEKYNMGWDDFITKPAEKDKLIKHIQDALPTPF